MPNRITKAILKGMEKAFRDHYRYSRISEDGDQTLVRRTPEYVFTVYIARQVMNLPNAPWVDIEDPVERAVVDAGGWGSGKIPRDTRRNGKFDITLSNASGPFGVVEVKLSHAMKKQVKADIVRICRVLNRGNNIRCGMLALLVSARWQDKNGVWHYSPLQDKRLPTIKKVARKIVKKKGNNLRVTCRKSVLTVDELQEYALMVFKISRPR